MSIESAEQMPNKPEQTPGQAVLGDLRTLAEGIEAVKQSIKLHRMGITPTEMTDMRAVVRELITGVECLRILTQCGPSAELVPPGPTEPMQR